jgi:MFS family permease
MPKRLTARLSAGESGSLPATSLVVLVGFWATTLVQPGVLGHIPLQNLLKNVLHSDRSANAAFFFWVGAPWYIKPLIGILSDAYPLLGNRRKSYLAIGGLTAVAGWAALSVTAHSYSTLLIVCMVINFAIVIASTAIGGFMIEAAQATGREGQLTSLRNAGYQSAWLVAGLIGGYLGALAIGWTALVCGLVAFLLAPLAWMMREPQRAPTGQRLIHDMAQQLKAMGRARGLWAVAMVAGVYYIAPGLVTTLFYLQQNTLHLTTPQQGYITFASGLGGVAAATAYGLFAARRFKLRAMMLICLTLGAAGILLFHFYDSFAQALLVETINGFTAALCEIVLIHVAVRATPRGSEALGFAVFMAVRNLFLFGSDWLGSTLVDRLHFSMDTLILTNVATTLVAAALTLLLPAGLVDVRDAGGLARQDAKT